ncbi:MAG: hypothetical protein AAF907_00790 [Planctomycetota bacterium]
MIASPRRRPFVRSRRRRAGLTLLELVVAGALTAGLTASLHVVLRGVTTATDQLRGEGDVLRHADQALRFVTRRCRQAVGVTTADADEIVLDLGGGDSVGFRRNGSVNDLQSDWTTGGVLETRTVAEHITNFAVNYYEADGVTVTTDPTAVQLIEITLTVDLPRDHDPGRTVSGRVWVRQW